MDKASKADKADKADSKMKAMAAEAAALHKTPQSATAGANIATINLATTTHAAASIAHNTPIKNAAVKCHNHTA
jgi:hypothetical protein